MTNIITLKHSLDHAYEEAFKSAEKGDFKRTITLMEYVQKYKQNYDPVMTNYLLLYSYFAYGDIENATKYLKVLKDLEIIDQQIKNVVNEIEQQIEAATEVDEIYEYIDTLYYRCEQNNLFNEYRQEYFLEMLYHKDESNALKTLKEMYDEANEFVAYINAIEKIEDIENPFAKLNIKTTLQVLNRLLINGFFWEFLTEDNFKAIVDSKEINPVIRQVFICIAINYSKYTNTSRELIKKYCKVNFKDQKFDMIHIFDCADYIARIMRKYEQINWTTIIDTIIAYIGTNKFHDSNILFEDYSVLTITQALFKIVNISNQDKLDYVSEHQKEDVEIEVNKILNFLNG